MHTGYRHHNFYQTRQKHRGVVNSPSGKGDITGVTLKYVKEIFVAGAPLKEYLFINQFNLYYSYYLRLDRPTVGLS